MKNNQEELFLLDWILYDYEIFTILLFPNQRKMIEQSRLAKENVQEWNLRLRELNRFRQNSFEEESKKNSIRNKSNFYLILIALLEIKIKFYSLIFLIIFTTTFSHKVNPSTKMKDSVQPYDIISQFWFKYAGITTYREMLKKQPLFIKEVEDKTDFDKMDHHVNMIDVGIQPQKIYYRIYKHSDEIKTFLEKMDHEILMMQAYNKRMSSTGSTIVQLHNNLRKYSQWGSQQIPHLLEYLDYLANHPFLRKSIRVLTFIEHCLPTDKWDVRVYQQVEIFKEPSFFGKIFSSDPPEVQYYLTVTSEGIFKSSKNLLQTRIQKMIPFTNQFRVEEHVSKQGINIKLFSCVHEGMNIDFKKDFQGGINFYHGLLSALTDSDVFETHRFLSFSSPRKNCWSKLYNCGEDYFSDLCDELNKAKFQVCITDWWMTPYFLLKRPAKIINRANRLDGVLQRLGERGVKISIILFREPLSIVCNDSRDAQLFLESLSRNIKVVRHPIMPQFWSHHEKSVIIDQAVGFMGGLDICYGRWDNSDHSLTNVEDKWNGADYTNERIRSFVPGTTKNFTDSPIDRETEPRMPWQDIGIQIRGDSVIDLLRHFVQYWYYVEGEKNADPYQHTKSLKKRYERASNYQEPDWEYDPDQEDYVKREETFGEKIGMCGKRTQLFFTGTEKRYQQLLIQVKPGRVVGNQEHQICRSASPWSIGASERECSIHNAYQKLIEESQNFIYIENQFFMGQENQVTQSMANRIRKAHQNRENFKVIVVMPLLPGFEGSVTDTKNGPLRIQVHNQFQCINRGKNSLHQKLSDLNNFDINNYIFFFGLRNHAILNGKPITQIIYVHSKLIIVDDKRALIGSANINDRSLLGDRDSELAIVVQQENGQIRDNFPRRGDIFNLRYRIFKSHFGLTEQETGNINSPQIWNKIIGNAKNNTLIYRKLFGCYPDNTITVSDQVEERQQEAQPELYSHLTPQIFGFAVEFPLDFMQDENLQFKTGQIQGFTPQMFL